MRPCHLLFIATLAVALASTPRAEPPEGGADPSPPERPRLALVLSGGGARGAAHVGVIGVLEELRVPIDLVVGTSMGAIVGGLYAAGYSPAEMEDALVSIEWEDVFNDRPPRRRVSFRRKQEDNLPLFGFELGITKDGLTLPSGLVAGQKLEFLLRKMTLHTTEIRSFDDLPIPFRAVAADVSTGEVVVLKEGSLAEAVRASMAVPGAFSPVELDGRLLVDGGVAANLPVQVARDLGADVVIAVDVTTPIEAIERQSSAVEVVAQTLDVMTTRNVNESRALLEERDVLVVPDLGEFPSISFSDAAQTFPVGRKAAEDARDSLERYAVDEAAFERYLERQRVRSKIFSGTEMVVAKIRVDGESRVSDRQIRARILTEVGDPLDLERLADDLARVYEIGEFEKVSFDIERAGDSAELVIRVQDKSWGPYYLRFGLELQSDFEGTGEFSALALLTRTQLNRLGLEWRSQLSLGTLNEIQTELYQPLDYGGFAFVSPQVTYTRDERVFRSQEGIVLGDLTSVEGRLDFGVQFRSVAELRVGVVRQEASIDVDAATVPLPRLDVTLAGARFAAGIDQLDSARFPRRGSAIFVEYFRSLDSLGADVEYERLDWLGVLPFTIGRNTLVLRTRYESDLGSGAPFYDNAEIGGFLDLSGVPPDSFSGQIAGLGQLIYYREIARLPGALGGGIYLGASVEAGNVWDDRDQVSSSNVLLAGSLFAGADTILGPLYVGYGQLEGGRRAYYLFLGRIF